MGCVANSDGAEIPRRSVSTIGLAALKSTDRCAHPFPINDPAENVADTACFLPRRQIAGSPKMGAGRSRRSGLAGAAPGWLLRAAGTAHRPADRLWRLIRAQYELHPDGWLLGRGSRAAESPQIYSETPEITQSNTRNSENLTFPRAFWGAFAHTSEEH